MVFEEPCPTTENKAGSRVSACELLVGAHSFCSRNPQPLEPTSKRRPHPRNPTRSVLCRVAAAAVPRLTVQLMSSPPTTTPRYPKKSAATLPLTLPVVWRALCRPAKADSIIELLIEHSSIHQQLLGDTPTYHACAASTCVPAAACSNRHGRRLFVVCACVTHRICPAAPAGASVYL